MNSEQDNHTLELEISKMTKMQLAPKLTDAIEER